TESSLHNPANESRRGMRTPSKFARMLGWRTVPIVNCLCRASTNSRQPSDFLRIPRSGQLHHRSGFPRFGVKEAREPSDKKIADKIEKLSVCLLQAVGRVEELVCDHPKSPEIIWATTVRKRDFVVAIENIG